MHVFTYGTLMFLDVWRTVVGREFRTVEGAAAGFAIFRVANAVFPGIVEVDAAAGVQGVVYLDVDERSVDRLDRFEDEFYERRTISIDCADGATRLAEAYVVPESKRGVLTTEPWERDTFRATGGLEKFIANFQGFGRVGESG
jgi:gamma-glutamylcyclotransferase (GGCT)/AIG2-like uncharacterized protein YtfP